MVKDCATLFPAIDRNRSRRTDMVFRMCFNADYLLIFDGDGYGAGIESGKYVTYINVAIEIKISCFFHKALIKLSGRRSGRRARRLRLAVEYGKPGISNIAS